MTFKKKKRTQLPETCMQCIIAFGLFSPIDEIPCKKRERNPVRKKETQKKKKKIEAN
jgi:hypothetical protein